MLVCNGAARIGFELVLYNQSTNESRDRARESCITCDEGGECPISSKAVAKHETNCERGYKEINGCSDERGEAKPGARATEMSADS
jgi:hypothetical protein